MSPTWGACSHGYIYPPSRRLHAAGLSRASR